jgi:hypothetical protein
MFANRPLVAYPLLALASFLVSVVGFDVVARVSVSDQTLRFALADSTGSIFGAPGLSIWLAVPFALMVMLAWWADRVVSPQAALTLSLVTAALFALIYFVGMWDAQGEMSHGGRNASELRVIVLPFICVPIVLAEAIMIAVAAQKRRARDR